MHAAVLTYLSCQSEPVTVACVARALDLRAWDVREALHELLAAGQAALVMVDGGERFRTVT